MNAILIMYTFLIIIMIIYCFLALSHIGFTFKKIQNDHNDRWIQSYIHIISIIIIVLYVIYVITTIPIVVLMMLTPTINILFIPFLLLYIITFLPLVVAYIILHKNFEKNDDIREATIVLIYLFLIMIFFMHIPVLINAKKLYPLVRKKLSKAWSQTFPIMQ